MKKLIIPTAKIVDKELQNIGELPPVIYPINDQIVFDYLYHQYKDKVSEIDLICYEKKELVKSKLKSFPDDKIKVIELSNIESLGRSIYEGIKNTTVPIIINLGDTIIEDNLTEEDKDAFFYSEEYLSPTWTYFNMNDGVLLDIYDKSLEEKKIKGKIFTGVFQILDTVYFTKCLEDAFNSANNDIGSFYIALRKYSEKYRFKAIKTDNWFDIGHLDKYYNSKLEVRSREFNHIHIDKNRGILKKYSDDKDKFIGEIKWYLKLPANLEYSRPRIFNYSLSYDNPYVEMEYYAYHTVHELFLYGDLKYKQWEDVFKRIKFICTDYAKYKVADDNIISSLKNMYLDKTIERLNKLRTDDNFKIFFDNEIYINNIKYNSLNNIIEKLKEVIPKMLYNIDNFNIIHGDLCFANIMIDNNLSFIKVIDPRGKFGKYDIYGDERYELAKLFHSVDGKYDYIIKNMFEINRENNRIDYKLSEDNLDFSLYELLIKTFDIKTEKLKEIELIESLLFLSMIPLHNESLNHQLAMLSTGIQILDRVVDIKED